MVLSGLQDEDSQIRETAISQLSILANGRQTELYRRIVPLLIPRLDDTDSIVCAVATAMLRKATGKPWIYSSRLPPARKTPIVAHWKRWWQSVQAQWPVAPADMAITALRPLRRDPAPPIQLSDVEGKPFQLDQQRGRITMLNFWGTWCSPCLQEIPDLIQTEAAFHDRGVDFLGLAVSERTGEDGLRKWCRQHGVTYRQALCPVAVQDAFGNMEGVPVTILIDRQGQIRYWWEGPRDAVTFRAALERVLKEP